MELHKQFAPKGLVVLAVSLDDGSADKVRAWAKAKKAPFAVVQDPGGKKVGPAYGIQFFPTHVLIDRSGKIVARSTEKEYLEIAELKKRIPALLPAKKK